MASLKLSTVYNRLFLMVLSSDHISAATGKTVAVNLSKAGAAFGAAAGAVTEIANGWYKIALTAADTNTLGDLAVNCTATACDSTDFSDQVIAFDLGVAAPSYPANFALLGIDSTGSVKIQVPLKRNVAFPNFPVVMRDANGNLASGLAITAQVTIDGAAMVATTNTPTELGGGWYLLSLAAADLNGTSIGLRFSAAGAQVKDIELFTQP